MVSGRCRDIPKISDQIWRLNATPRKFHS